jgi:hypothetical protein
MQEFEFAPATALEAAERDAATRDRTVVSFVGIEVIPDVYTHSAIVYVDSEGETRQTLTGPFGHYQEYWDYFRTARKDQGPRRFADAEREAFGDGAEILRKTGSGWHSAIVAGGITMSGIGDERVELATRLSFKTWGHTTGIRALGARVGLDFQWEERDGKRKACVFFCERCGSTKGRFGRSIYKAANEYGYSVAWGSDPVPRGFELADVHMLAPSVMECTCSKTGGGYIDSREYWRRVIAVEAAGFEVWDVPGKRSYQYYECVVNGK